MTQNKTAMWIAIYAFLFLLGWGLTYLAYVQYQKTSKLLASGIRTTATVTDLIESRDSDGTTYSPVFEFTDKSMTKRTFTSSIRSRPAAYKVGEKVKIVYDQKNTEDVKTISFWGLYRGSIILLMISAPLLIVGGSYLLYITK